MSYGLALRVLTDRWTDRGTDRTENITLTTDVGGKHVILDHRQCPIFILPNDVDDPVILNIAKTVTCGKESMAQPINIMVAMGGQLSELKGEILLI